MCVCVCDAESICRTARRKPGIFRMKSSSRPRRFRSASWATGPGAAPACPGCATAHGHRARGRSCAPPRPAAGFRGTQTIHTLTVSHTHIQLNSFTQTIHTLTISHTHIQLNSFTQTIHTLTVSHIHIQLNSFTQTIHTLRVSLTHIQLNSFTQKSTIHTLTVSHTHIQLNSLTQTIHP